MDYCALCLGPPGFPPAGKQVVSLIKWPESRSPCPGHATASWNNKHGTGLHCSPTQTEGQMDRADCLGWTFVNCFTRVRPAAMDRKHSERVGAEQELSCFFALFSLQGPITSVFPPQTFVLPFYSVSFYYSFPFWRFFRKRNACNFYVIICADSRQTEHVSFDIYFDKYL